MLDYIFFHPFPAKQFTDFLKQKSIDTTMKRLKKLGIGVKAP